MEGGEGWRSIYNVHRYPALMSSNEHYDEYRSALARLSALGVNVAEQSGAEDVYKALLSLQLAIVRAYGGRRPRANPGEGARVKILRYLQDNVGRWVHGEELAAVSGIGEWARRVRELRVEHGYDIEEEKGSYRLVRAEANESAERWRKLNAIRRQAGSGRSRIEALFEEMVGQVVTREDLDYVAQIKEGSRRVRELRDEFGWPIESHLDAPDLRPGQYRLVSIREEDRKDPKQRLYPENLRERIFKRDNYTCRRCGRDKFAAERAGDSRFYLEVHHLHALADDIEGLSRDELNDPSNLVTYCHGCHRVETADFQRTQRNRRMTARGHRPDSGGSRSYLKRS